MKFWDSSAVVPLVIREASSPRCLGWLREDPEVMLWCLSPVEVTGALWRRYREDDLSAESMNRAQARLGEILAAAYEVVHVERVRRRAIRVLAVHPLRAPDALQLAAALVAAEEEPSRLDFVTLDDRLADAAGREGFTLHSL